MRVNSLRVQPSPRIANAVRASVTVSYASRFARPERWWFEVPAHLGEDLSQRGEPWLAALLPLAFTLGEPLEIDLPIEPRVLEGAERIQSIWADWYPQFRAVPVNADEKPPPSRFPRVPTACFFSSGIDSLFTVLHRRDIRSAPVDELLYLQGFEVELSNRSALAVAQTKVEESARRLRTELITMATNVRSTRLRETNWGRLAHGSILAAAGLLLGPRYREVLISSTWPVDLSRPLGSHPEVDPNYSTSRTQIQLYLPQTRRSEKVSYLSQHPGLLENLRVCWESESGGNCGRCSKCLTAMIALEIYGSLEGCSAFPQDWLDPARIRGVYLGRKAHHYQELREAAEEQGRGDIIQHLEAAFQLTDRINRWFQIDRLLPLFRRMRFNPLIRRITRPLRPIGWRVLRWFNRRLL